MANEEVKSIEEATEKIAQMQADGTMGKPSDEEVTAALKEFEDGKAEFEAKRFNIGTSEIATEIYTFMIEFMEKHVYWTKNGWMGVVRMHEELTKELKNRKDDEAFNTGYQALEFMFFALSNPGGNGIESARAIEKVADFYANLIEITAKQLEDARKELKDVQWLGDRVAAMQQGFYLEKEDGAEPEDADNPDVPTFASPSPEDLLKPTN